MDVRRKYALTEGAAHLESLAQALVFGRPVSAQELLLAILRVVAALLRLVPADMTLRTYLQRALEGVPRSAGVPSHWWPEMIAAVEKVYSTYLLDQTCPDIAGTLESATHNLALRLEARERELELERERQQQSQDSRPRRYRSWVERRDGLSPQQQHLLKMVEAPGGVPEARAVRAVYGDAPKSQPWRRLLGNFRVFKSRVNLKLALLGVRQRIDNVDGTLILVSQKR